MALFMEESCHVFLNLDNPFKCVYVFFNKMMPFIMKFFNLYSFKEDLSPLGKPHEVIGDYNFKMFSNITN